MTSRHGFALLSILALLAACGDDDAPTDTDAGMTEMDADMTEPDAGMTIEPVCSEPTPVPCEDESVLELALFAPPNPAMITNTADGDGWLTHVDATGGGFNPTLSYVYARFTDEGLVRVDVGDEDAFGSMDWDIAFRRFVIRLNSGVSGPSCVSAARTGATTEYDTLDAVPAGLDYRVEEYFTPTCDFVPDGSGLMSPGTALQSFWRYPGCVQMTNNVYIVRLADGRQLKMTVLSYYEPEAQATCDATGSSPMPNGSGNIRLRWELLTP